MKLWVIWILVTDVGLALAIAIVALGFYIVVGGDTSSGDPTFYEVGVCSLLGGMLMGLCQWLVLRKKIIRASRWILATALGGAILGSGFAAAPEVLSRNVGFVAIPIAVGCGIVGLAQWVVLRREVRGAGWWVLASIIGGTCAGLATMAIANTGLAMEPGIIPGVIGSLSILGMVTGIAFVFFFEQSSQRCLGVMITSGLSLALILAGALLVDGVYSQQKFTLRGHPYQVLSVAFSPDGLQLASGSWGGTLKLWDVVSGQELRTWNARSDGVNSVAFSPDGTLLAASFDDGTVILWDAAHGQQRKRLGSYWPINSVVFSPDGRILATGGGAVPGGGKVTLWDVTSGKPLQIFDGHAAAVNSVAFSPDGQLLASGGGVNDSTVRIWDITTGQELHIFHGDRGWIESVAFSPDGRLVASGGWLFFDPEPEDRAVILWDVISGQRVRTFGGQANVESIAFSPDGKLLAVAPDGKLLVPGFVSVTAIRLWEVATGKEVDVLRGHSNKVTSVAFSPDGNLLASGSYDDTVRLWDVPGER